MSQTAATPPAAQTASGQGVRISERDLAAMRRVFHEFLPGGSTVYLFGSRTDLAKRGGDIDLLAHVPGIAPREGLSLEMRIVPRLWDAIGEQKIDFVVTPSIDGGASAFVRYVIMDAVPLWTRPSA